MFGVFVNYKFVYRGWVINSGVGRYYVEYDYKCKRLL